MVLGAHPLPGLAPSVGAESSRSAAYGRGQGELRRAFRGKRAGTSARWRCRLRDVRRGQLAGEITLSSIQRGPFQQAYIGYWVDEELAGKGFAGEAVVIVLRYTFEELGLHRVEIAIVPRNSPSRRVVEKLGLREEGIALGFLEIDGKWEDHVRYAITTEEW